MTALLVTAICVMAVVIALLTFIVIITRNRMIQTQALVWLLQDRVEVLEKKEINHA